MIWQVANVLYSITNEHIIIIITDGSDLRHTHDQACSEEQLNRRQSMGCYPYQECEISQKYNLDSLRGSEDN